FGMATPAYLARKELKKAYYNREYGPYGWWHWDAMEKTDYQELPPFPEAKRYNPSKT
ncbi:DUF1173 domain-containing protein, partial [Escherichia coli]|nr:DUF1173 domain-containing protein [Escherichia coli]EFI9755754.1 DUF1173 domain-containing protein [Escherichia coli]